MSKFHDYISEIDQKYFTIPKDTEIFVVDKIEEMILKDENCADGLQKMIDEFEVFNNTEIALPFKHCLFTYYDTVNQLPTALYVEEKKYFGRKEWEIIILVKNESLYIPLNPLFREKGVCEVDINLYFIRNTLQEGVLYHKTWDFRRNGRKELEALKLTASINCMISTILTSLFVLQNKIVVSKNTKATLQQQWQLKNSGKNPKANYYLLDVPVKYRYNKNKETFRSWHNRHHKCRGHFKKVNNLFGKGIKGRYWWNPFHRGEVDLGEVFKQYGIAIKEDKKNSLYFKLKKILGLQKTDVVA